MLKNSEALFSINFISSSPVCIFGSKISKIILLLIKINSLLKNKIITLFYNLKTIKKIILKKCKN